MRVRWPDGSESELRNEIAQRIARKGGCSIIAAAVTPQPDSPPSSVAIIAPPEANKPVRATKAGRRPGRR